MKEGIIRAFNNPTGYFRLVRHIFREANRCADWLANYAYSLPLAFYALQHPPAGLSSIVLGDIIGISVPRLWFAVI
jgi:hypothetical protein